jgi:hypothetical protein
MTWGGWKGGKGCEPIIRARQSLFMIFSPSAGMNPAPTSSGDLKKPDADGPGVDARSIANPTLRLPLGAKDWRFFPGQGKPWRGAA